LFSEGIKRGEVPLRKGEGLVNNLYKEESDLKLGYAKLGEMLGMDVKKSPPRPQKYQKY